MYLQSGAQPVVVQFWLVFRSSNSTFLNISFYNKRVKTEPKVIGSGAFFRGESENQFSRAVPQSPGFRAKFETLIVTEKKMMYHFLNSAELDSPESLPRFQCENKRWDGTLCWNKLGTHLNHWHAVIRMSRLSVKSCWTDLRIWKKYNPSQPSLLGFGRKHVTGSR